MRSDYRGMDGNINSCGSKSVVILGAGMGGLRTAFKLEKKLKKMRELNILLIDQNDYHQYLHRFHELAGGNLPETAATVPINRLINKKRIQFINTTVTGINLDQRSVETSNGKINYDFLVISLGSQDEFFGIGESGKQSFCTLKSFHDACLTKAKIVSLANKDNANIVIVGGGFTGTELAGELADFYSKNDVPST